MLARDKLPRPIICSFHSRASIAYLFEKRKLKSEKLENTLIHNFLFGSYVYQVVMNGAVKSST